MHLKSHPEETRNISVKTQLHNFFFRHTERLVSNFQHAQNSECGLLRGATSLYLQQVDHVAFLANNQLLKTSSQMRRRWLKFPPILFKKPFGISPTEE